MNITALSPASVADMAPALALLCVSLATFVFLTVPDIRDARREHRQEREAQR